MFKKTLKSNGQVPGKLPCSTFSSASHCLKRMLIPWMMVGCGLALIISRKSIPLPCFSLKQVVRLLPSQSTYSPTCPQHTAISASLPLLFSAALDCSLNIFLHSAAKGGTTQRHGVCVTQMRPAFSDAPIDCTKVANSLEQGWISPLHIYPLMWSCPFNILLQNAILSCDLRLSRSIFVYSAWV